MFKQIDAFNQDCLNSLPRLQGQMERNQEYLFPKEASERLSASLQSIREWFSMADTLSSHYQEMKLSTLKKLFGIVSFAVLFFEAYAHLRPDLNFLLYLYPLLLAAALLKFRATKGGWEDKHQDYRALAEALRVLFFWRLTGIQDSPADHYPHTQKTELDWILKTNFLMNALIPASTDFNRTKKMIRLLAE